MSHTIKCPYYWVHNRAWSVNAKGQGLRTDILKALLGQFNVMLESHNKIFVYRFDLHSPTYAPKNNLITAFNRRLFKRIKRHYDLKRIGFCWVREQEKVKQQHYHFVLMLDGNKIQYYVMLQKWITEIWQHMDGTTTHWARYRNITRGDEAAIQSASYHMSYLAKPRGKGKRPIQTKDYGASRLKPKTTSL